MFDEMENEQEGGHTIYKWSLIYHSHPYDFAIQLFNISRTILEWYSALFDLMISLANIQFILQQFVPQHEILRAQEDREHCLQFRLACCQFLPISVPPIFVSVPPIFILVNSIHIFLWVHFWPWIF